MNDHERLRQLTNLLYGLAVVVFAGTILELLAAKHFEEPIQLLPFALCGIGLAVVLLAWRQPGRAAVQTLRGLMGITAAASLLGVWKHVEGNIGFVREMHPDATGWAVIQGALTGRAPLLASGALAVAACIAIVATFAAGWDLSGVRDRQGKTANDQQLTTVLTSASIR